MSKELKTGIAVVLILCLGYWGFSFLKGQNLLEHASRVFFIEYDNIQGLNKASTVSINGCLLYTSPSPRDRTRSRMPSSA